MNRNQLAATLVLSTIAFTASKALADSTLSGVASNIETYTNSSDKISNFAGSLSVTTSTSTTPSVFYWGGSRCSIFSSPSSTQIQMLTTAIIAKKNILVYFKNQNGNQCLTGFRLPT